MSGARRPVTIDYAVEVRALEPAVRLRLAGKLGVPAVRDDAKLVDAVSTALVTPEGAGRVLASLTPDARDLARLESTYSGPIQTKELSAWARDELGWTKLRFAQAQAELLACGLLWKSSKSMAADTISCLHAFDAGQRPTHDAWSAGVLPDARPVVPAQWRLALLVAYAGLDPVRRTQAGGLNAHWVERVFACFAPLGTSIHHLYSEMNLLVNMGIIAPSGEAADADRLQVVPAMFERLGERPTDLARAVLGCAGTATVSHARGLFVGLARLRRNGHVGPAPLPDVLSALREVDPLALWEACEAPTEHFNPGSLARAAGVLRGLGLLTVESGGGILRVSEAPDPPPPTAGAPAPIRSRWIVQPNFEVLVPADADPVATAYLGVSADLVATDRVARFRLTQESIGRATLEAAGAEAAIERLREGAVHGLPDNVEATLCAWARRAVVARGYRGGVIVAGSEDQARLLRARPDVRREIAPGVFHVASNDVASILRDVSGEGHPVAPVVGEGHGPVRPRPVESASVHAERLLKLLDRVASTPTPELRRRAEEQARLKAEADAAASRGKRSSRDGAREEATSDPRFRRNLVQVARRWPLVASLVEVRPDLIRTVLSVHEDTLWSAEESGSPRSAERFLVEVGEMMGLLPGKQASGPTSARRSPDEEADEESDDEADAEDESDDFEMGGPVTDPSPVESRRLGLDRDWQTLAIGHLEDVLKAAADAEVGVEILYVNAAGEKKARAIEPESIYRQKRRVWLDATEQGTDVAHTFALDRIAAIRALEA